MPKTSSVIPKRSWSHPNRRPKSKKLNATQSAEKKFHLSCSTAESTLIRFYFDVSPTFISDSQLESTEYTLNLRKQAINQRTANQKWQDLLMYRDIFESFCAQLHLLIASVITTQSCRMMLAHLVRTSPCNYMQSIWIYISHKSPRIEYRPLDYLSNSVWFHWNTTSFFPLKANSRSIPSAWSCSWAQS